MKSFRPAADYAANILETRIKRPACIAFIQLLREEVSLWQWLLWKWPYRKISNIRRTKSTNLNVSSLVFAQSIEARR